jgi:hypothetical protein
MANKYLVVSILAVSLLLTSFRVAEKVENLRVPEAPAFKIEGGRIIVSGLPGFEESPRAAYSPESNQYLVVFTDYKTNNDDIKGRYVDASTGETVGSVFTIAGNSNKEWNPDVVYDPHNERFLVVWGKFLCMMVGDEEVCDAAIAGRMLYAAHSDDSQFAGGEFIVAHQHNYIDLYDPRVAYNQIDKQYLVVFRTGTHAVHGQMLAAHASYPSTLYPHYGFTIRDYYDGTEVNDPDVAWGREYDTFLVVWQNVRNKYEDGTIQAKYLHDIYQGGGSQISGSEFKVAPFAEDPYPLSNDCTFPVVAFNPGSGYYTIVFRHRAAAGLDEPLTLYAQLIKPDHENNSRKGTAFPVETDLSEENVSYVHADIDYSGMGDSMYVVYIKLISNWSTVNPIFASVHARRINGIDVSPALIIRDAEQDVYMFDSSVAGTSDGRALLVWGEQDSVGSTEAAIVAARLEPYWQYLPAVLNGD